MCGQIIKITAGDSPDAKVNEHILKGCSSNLLKTHEIERKSKKKKCGLSSCQNPENFDLMSCSSCNRQYCITHRLPDDHNCTKASGKTASVTNTAAAALLQRLQGNRDKQERDRRKRQAAMDKVKSKKMEQKQSQIVLSKPIETKENPKEKITQQQSWHSQALGSDSISTSDRFYLRVNYPKSYGGKKREDKDIFGSKNWTVGKLLDDISERLSMDNRNNDPTQKRLGLYAFGTNPIEFPNDIPLLLLHPQLKTGDSVQLLYK